MNRKNISSFVLGLVMIGAAVFLITRRKTVHPVSTLESAKTDCTANKSPEEKPMVFDDPSMVLKDVKPGDAVRSVVDAYLCHAPKVGDVVVYRFSEERDPVMRRVRAVAGDHFKVVQSADKKAWNLEINDQLVLNANDEPYRFGAAAPPLLKLYEKEREETGLGKDELIITVDQGPAQFDSGSLGVVSVGDMKAKILEN